jgi:hypothetical protein
LIRKIPNPNNIVLINEFDVYEKEWHFKTPPISFSSYFLYSNVCAVFDMVVKILFLVINRLNIKVFESLLLQAR